ncbi:DUF29 domain-containing protein [Acaryochloris marina]|uniref:DUF29 domain-containing protein n=1 Tax=Acaryochloris marina (strain MBIC 11017) TaxID=329726 RepID=A8ZQG4_ACAM1|nr:DUF29 domain-containing protein [Acaryochloris marina]ABW33250.1 conserved hypothetical protein [Acaryochloris marina MBIC11017]
MAYNIQTLYETDVVKWSLKQAKLLKARKFDLVDLENLIEEIEDVARRYKDVIEGQIENLLVLILTVKYKPQKQTKSWDKDVLTSQAEIHKWIEKEPSLHRHALSSFNFCYKYARIKVSILHQISLASIPEECPEDVRITAWELINRDDGMD